MTGLPTPQPWFSANIFGLRSKTNAFKKKLALWDRRVQEGDLEMFLHLYDFLTSAGVNNSTLKGIS